jgi:predicted permease
MIFSSSLIQDLRYGARVLHRNPGLTSVAVLALALGIGVNTVVFTAYKAIVTRPLDAANSKEMVNIALLNESGSTEFKFSYPDYQAFRDSVRSLSGLVAMGSPQTLRLSTSNGFVSQRSSAAESGLGKLGLLSGGASRAEFASVLLVSENYFQVLGVPALRGRTFENLSANQLLTSPSVLISENYWQQRFAGDPAILGKPIYLNGTAFAIVGITPRNFVGTSVAVPDFWLPISLDPLVHVNGHLLADRENQCCRLFGRLANGAGMSQAQPELNRLANGLRALHELDSELAKPASVLIWPGSPFPLPLKMYRGLTLAIFLIMTAGAMVLAVACANVGSLQLARARSRDSELRTRLSLGASRLRLVSQLLTESALLALLAGALALPCTWVILRFAATLAARALPPDIGTLIFDVTPDVQIFLYTLAVSLLAGLLFGVTPTLEASRAALPSAARGSTSAVRSRRIQDLLVTMQVAFSLVIMIAGGMLIRSSLHSLNMTTGYDTKHVVDLILQFPEKLEYTPERKLTLVRDLRDRIASLPGVVGISSSRPPGDSGTLTAAAALDFERSSARTVPSMHYTWVDAAYFQTLDIPVDLGRAFRQTGESQNSIIFSESAALQLWPAQNPLGRSVRLGATDNKPQFMRRDLVADGLTYQVVGVARDIRGFELNGSDSRLLYLPLAEDKMADYPLLVRTQFDTTPVIHSADAVISSVDPQIALVSSTLEEQLQQSAQFLISVLAASIASIVGLLGLVLALMGIYGTVSYIVALRTREIGIRMAVGAQKLNIFRLILRESTRPVFAGLFAGVLLAVGISYLLHGILYGLSIVDAPSFVGVSLLFLAVAMLAAYPPARRAIQVDPVVALRHE